MGRNVLFAVLFALATLAPINAQPVPPETQTSAPAVTTPSPKPKPATLCLAKLAFLIPIDADGAGVAHSYRMALAPFSNSSGLASGVISLYDGANRWDVPFHDAIVATEDQKPEPTAIVVHFPQPIQLESARLAALDGPNGGPCRPYSIAAVTPAQVTSTFVQGVLAKASAVHAIDVPQPVSDAVAACLKPSAPPRLRTYIVPDTPEIAKEWGQVGIVQIRVWVDDSGNVLAANVYNSSGWKSLDDASLAAAASSTYFPAVYNCRPIGGIDIFKVEFAQDPPY